MSNIINRYRLIAYVADGFIRARNQLSERRTKAVKLRGDWASVKRGVGVGAWLGLRVSVNDPAFYCTTPEEIWVFERA